MSTETKHESMESLLEPVAGPSRPNVKALKAKLNINLQAMIPGAARPAKLSLQEQEDDDGKLQTNPNDERIISATDEVPKKLNFVKRTKAKAGRALPERWKKSGKGKAKVADEENAGKIIPNESSSVPNSSDSYNLVPICSMLCITGVTLVLLYLLVIRRITNN